MVEHMKRLLDGYVRVLGLGVALGSACFVGERMLANEVGVLPAASTDSSSAINGGLTEYRSRHFVMHSDLPLDEAEEVLLRMEGTLKFASKYWGRQQRGEILCYVVQNLNDVPDSSLPHPFARVLIGGVGGATIPQATDADGPDNRRFVVYAANRPGIVEHEVIHAYCGQTFGVAGPDWYKEGMAEMGCLFQADQLGVNCSAKTVRFLRSDFPQSLAQIVGRGRFTSQISQSLAAAQSRHGSLSSHIPLSVWTEKDIATVERVRTANMWSWALCHLLSHNPNYSSRFRVLGRSCLANGQDQFDQLFRSMHREIDFEYSQFLRNFDVGYRVDLCRWDWKKQFKTTDDRASLKIRVAAKRGYQPSGLAVKAGQQYKYSARGKWSLKTDRLPCGANGQVDGQGRLEGVIMRDYTLGEPFELGVSGSFRAPQSGQLFLRCRCEWNDIADNQGSVLVQLSGAPG